MNGPLPGFMIDERGCLDPYRLAHKGLRVTLARLLESAGRADFADARARERIRHESLETVHLLRTHARLEGLFLDPLLTTCASEGADCARHDHAKLESELFTLVLALDSPSEGETSTAEARARGHRFYIALTRLVAHYLLHMAEEETRVLALLHEHVDDDLLRRMVVAAESTMSAEESARTSAAIAEGVAPHERESLGGSARRERARPSRPPTRARSNRHV
jgi:hypothetical protein